MFYRPGAEGAEELEAQGFNPDLYTQFGETADTWKASLDGANNTGWKPMLCYIAFRSVERSLEDLLATVTHPCCTTNGSSIMRT